MISESDFFKTSMSRKSLMAVILLVAVSMILVAPTHAAYPMMPDGVTPVPKMGDLYAGESIGPYSDQNTVCAAYNYQVPSSTSNNWATTFWDRGNSNQWQHNSGFLLTERYTLTSGIISGYDVHDRLYPNFYCADPPPDPYTPWSYTLTGLGYYELKQGNRPAPAVNFSASPTFGTAILTVNFTDRSTDDPSEWYWSFGDGAISTGRNTIHAYTEPGSYTVSHSATNSAGTGWLNRTAYVNVTGQVPVANFTAMPTYGDAPLTVQFTDSSTGSPTSWNWSFGDGAFSTAQNPSHQYTSAGTYDVSLNATNAGGSNATVKAGYVVVISHVACDASGPYVNFVIENVSCPERNSGAWYGAVCVDNAMIRWALAGKSTPFYTDLSPLMWKRNLGCPNPGHSWAVDSPYNKPVYFVAVENSDSANVWYHHHAVAAEYLSDGDVRNSTWQNWKFFNYDDLNITIAPGSQIPSGTQISNTTVTIKNITRVYSCGQRDSTIVRSFTIDMNNETSPIPAQFYPQGSMVSKTGKTQVKTQNIPDNLMDELRSLNDNGQFIISKWEFDPTSNELLIYAYDIGKLLVIDDIQTKTIGEYSVRMIHDTEFEKNRADVRQQLGELMKNSDYQIASIDMTTDTLNDPPENYVEIWVYKSTPENKNLDNSVINGWKILVYPVSQPPPDSKKT